MALCSVISDFQEFDVMGLFLSTSITFTEYAPPKANSWSAQGLESFDLQCPFVELPFRNPREERIVEGGRDTNLDSFCSIHNLANLSRPL